MPQGNDSQINVKVGLNTTELERMRWPGDYTVHIAQEVDSSGLKKAVFLSDYKQVVTQHIQRDGSWKNAIFVGDSVATTHMRLDNSEYLRQLNATPTGNSSFTVFGQVYMKGQQEINAAIDLLSRLPSQFYVDGQFNGKEVREGLQDMFKGCMTLTDVFSRLDNAMKAGNGTAGQLSSELKKALDMGSAVNTAQEQITRIRAMFGAGKRGDAKYAQYAKESGFTLAEEFVQRGIGIKNSGSISEKIGWSMDFAARYKSIIDSAEKRVNRYGQYATEESYKRAEQRYNKLRKQYDELLGSVRTAGGTRQMTARMQEVQAELDNTKKKIKDYEKQLRVSGDAKFKFDERGEVRRAISEIDKLEKEIIRYKNLLQGMSPSTQAAVLKPLRDAINARQSALTSKDALLAEKDIRVLQSAKDAAKANFTRLIGDPKEIRAEQQRLANEMAKGREQAAKERQKQAEREAQNDARIAERNRANRQRAETRELKEMEAAYAKFTEQAARARSLAQSVGAQMNELNWIRRIGEETPASTHALEVLTARMRELFAAIRGGNIDTLKQQMRAMQDAVKSANASLRIEGKFGDMTSARIAQEKILQQLNESAWSKEAEKRAGERNALEAKIREYGKKAEGFGHPDDLVRYRAMQIDAQMQLRRLQNLGPVDRSAFDTRTRWNEAGRILENSQQLRAELEITAKLQDSLNAASSQYGNIGSAAYAKVADGLKNVNALLEKARNTKDAKIAASLNTQAEKRLATVNEFARQAQIVKSLQKDLAQLAKYRKDALGAKKSGTERGDKIWKQYESAVNKATEALARFQAAQKGALTATWKKMNGTTMTSSVGSLARESANLAIAQSQVNAATQRMSQVSAINQKATQEAYAKSQEAAQKYLAQIQSINTAHQRSNGLVSQLGQEIAMVYSVQQVRNFLKSVVEIGGQFEYQRASIANILKDAGKADVLFTRIKGLALHSPFSTLQLDQAAKELSAFEIPYNELFSKLKSIADISAGTGTDISRIILAYGHVKSAGYLEGMQRRQFTNANINIIGELAKLYRERGETNVTRRAIYERISDKKVTFEDVDEVFKRLTQAGGQFYNMQEAMADTTKGVWKNAGDAINHMYMDIEKNFSGALKTTGLVFTQMTKGFSAILPVLLHVGTAMAALSLYSATRTRATGKETSTVIAQARANHSLQNSIYKLTGGMAGEAMVSRNLTEAEMRHLVTTERLTKESALRALATGRLRYAEGQHLVTLGLINQAQLDSVSSSRLMQRTWMTTANIIAGGVAKIGTALRGLLYTIPQMALLSLAFEGVSRAFGAISKAFGYDLGGQQKSQLDQMNELSNGATKSIRDILAHTNRDDIGKMTASQAITTFEEMSTTLKDNVEAADAIIEKLSRPNGGETFLQGQIRKTQELYDILKSIADIEAGAGSGDNAKFMQWVNDVGGWDSYEDNLKDYSNDTKKMYKAQAKLGSVNERVMQKFLNAMKESNKEIASIIDNSENVGQIFDRIAKSPSAMSFIAENSKRGGALYSLRDDAGQIEDYLDRTRIAYSSYNDVMDDTRQIVNAYLRDKGLWDNAKNAPSDAVRNIKLESKEFQEIMQNLRNYHLSIEGLDPEWADVVRSQIAKEVFDVNLHPTISKDVLVGWQKEVTDVLGEAFVQIAKGSDSFFDFRKAAAKAVKDAQSVINSAGEVIIGAKFNVKMGQDFSGDINELKKYFGGAGERVLAIDPKKGIAFKGKNYVNQTDIDMLETYYKQALLLQGLFNENKAGTHFIDSQELNKGKKGSKRDTDEELKKQQKRFQQLQQIRKVYEEWAKQKGAPFAIDKLKSDVELKDIFREFFENADLVDDDVMGKVIDDFLAKLGDKFSKGSEERKALWAQVWRAGQDNALSIAKRHTDELIKAIDRDLDQRKNKINLYEKLYDATGNKDIATLFAFGGNAPSYLDDYDVWDKTQDAIVNFNEKMSRLASQYGKTYDFYELLGLDAKALANLPDEVRKSFDDARKEFENAQTQQYERMVEALKQHQGIADRLMQKRKEIEREQQLLDLAAGSMIDPAVVDETKRRMNAEQNLSELKETVAYTQFMGNVLAMNDAQVKNIADSLRSSLMSAWESNTISVQQYAEELGKIAEIEKKMRTEHKLNFGDRTIGFLLGGRSGLKSAQSNERRQEEIFRLQKVADTANLRYQQALQGHTQGVVSDEDLEAFKKAMHDAAKALENFKSTVTWFDGMKEQLGQWNKGLNGAIGAVEGLQGAFKEVSDTFYAYGNKKMGDVFSNVSDGVGVLGAVLSPVSNLVQSAMSGDIGGILKNLIMAPVSLVTGPMKAIAALHDKIKSQQIEDNKEIVANLTYEYNKMQREISHGFGRQTDEYKKQLENLKEQLSYQQKMRELEEDKKNTDKDALRSYDEAIEGLNEQVKYFAAELYNAMYGIDFKGWASQLSDAIWEAFESGNDAALAWKDTVGDFIRDVAKKFINVGFIEPALETLQKKYLEGDSAIWRTTDDMTKETIGQLGDDLMDLYSSVAPAIGMVNDYINEAIPYSGKTSGSGGLSQIGQSLTEDTGSILSSLVNSIHYDTSAMRTIADQQLSELRVIASHTDAINSLLDKVSTYGGNTALNVRMIQ